LTCRLVNHAWNTRAIPWIQAKRKESLTLKNEDVPKFCADFEKTLRFPLGKLRINLNSFSLDHCSKVFTQYGARIQVLKITESTGGCIAVDDELSIRENLQKLQFILRSVPNLKKLSLKLDLIPKADSFDTDGMTLNQVDSLGLSSPKAPLTEGVLKKLFTVLSNVKVLELEDFSPDQDWTVFADSLQKLKVHTIDSKFFLESERPAHYKSLSTETSPRLLKLVMWVKPVLGLPNPVQLLEAQEELLRAQSDCLEDLDLTFFREMKHSRKLNLPVMTTLKSARFTCLGLSRYIDPIEPDQLQSLQKLTIFPTMIATTFANASFTSVQEIHLGICRTETLPVITTRFPNLRKLTGLETCPDENSMEAIVTNLQNIEDLEIRIINSASDRQLKNFNLFVSGVHPENEWVLNQIAESVGFAALSSFIDPPRPSLRDLKGNFQVFERSTIHVPFSKELFQKCIFKI